MSSRIKSLLKKSHKKTKKSVRISATSMTRIMDPNFLHYITPKQRHEFPSINYSRHEKPYKDIFSDIRRTRKHRHHM